MNYKIQKNVIENAEKPPLNRLQNTQTLVWQEKECKLVCDAERVNWEPGAQTSIIIILPS